MVWMSIKFLWFHQTGHAKKMHGQILKFSDILPKLHFALSILLALQQCRIRHDGGQRERVFFASEEVTSSRT